jgi:endonuclease YncB( thermonuclease family)
MRSNHSKLRDPRRGRGLRLSLGVAILYGTGGGSGSLGATSVLAGSPAKIAEQHVTNAPQPLQGCRVIDGDTLRCGAEQVRLLAIDAPEVPGHCGRGRRCAPGDPLASTRSLEQAAVGALTIQRVGKDRYGRTLALVTARVGDLSCYQLRARMAVYRRQWDNGERVARICPAAVR